MSESVSIDQPGPSAAIMPVIASPIPEPELPLLHDRVYSVRAYRRSTTEMMIRGQVEDRKPPGLYVDSDPDPLTVHHMVIDIVVVVPSMEITAAEVVMEVHPHSSCPTITDHYESLVGLSIARGFTHKVRELFGGPRGCTHTTALLQAMAPVAIQTVWSMMAAAREEGSTPVPPPLPSNPTDEQVRERFAFNLNTCHVWDENGEVVDSLKRGEEMEPPLWITRRLAELGISFEEWQSRLSGSAGQD